MRFAAARDRGSSGRGSQDPRPDLYAFAALWRHYRACRRGKRATANALAFEVDAEANLLRLATELRDHCYRPGRSICFITDGPKPREVFAADFRDRVVHHLLVHHQERLFEPRFIHDSFACRRARGVLAASDRLMAFLRSVTANRRRPAWALKLDIAGFFPSIHKPTLLALLLRRTRHPELRWLTRTILLHDPTTDYRFRSLDRHPAPPGTPGYPVPGNKSLFDRGNEFGLPIGNLTSQFWANVYLNEIDQLVKHRLRCRHYLRYVDDLVLLSEDRDQLLAWRVAIAACAAARLRLALRDPAAEPFPVAGGVDFVGWHTWATHRVPRRRTLAALAARLRRFERRRVRRAFGGAARAIDVALPPRAGLRRPGAARRIPTALALTASLASSAGHLRHGAARRWWRLCWAAHPWLGALFTCQGWRLRARWAASAIWSDDPRRRYRGLARAAGDDVLLFMRIGTHVEFLGRQRLMAQRRLGLRPVGIRRFGYALTVGFPARLAARQAQRALGAGHVALLAHEIREIRVIGGGRFWAKPLLTRPAPFAQGAPRRE